MPSRLIDPTIDRVFRDSLTSLLTDLGKKGSVIAAMPPVKTKCPNCITDGVTGSGGKYNGTGPKPFTGKVCPVCDNTGYTQTQQNVTITAHTIQWGKPNPGLADRPLPEGWIPEGYVKIKVLVAYYNTLDTAQFFLIDGIRCIRAARPRKRGLQSYVAAECLLKRDD